ncbi:ATP-binding cassette domain-containing protein [Marinobacterium mangrovicola]|uniref:ABC-type multidrug transport system fused ATPase/permease subunit n=1 Tax=Marinobacterium mangrovicola TaxID=1476959 RepID=A0A4R1GQJ6_9GAMM|nr:ABC transporter ATP-binding protein [Marinobacterium mangrovicola]TCK09275.1 ABC-type multidrug transport system fused ATPase/permease subunit [Marinobacterium mangrovicola]
MTDLKRVKTDYSRLVRILRPAMAQLCAGTVFAALAGLTKLAAFWALVQLIGEPVPPWVLYAAMLFLTSAACASASSWLSHNAEAQAAAMLRRQVATHLTRLPASTLAKWQDSKIRGFLADDVAALHHVVAHLPGEIATFFVVPLASIILLVSIAGVGSLAVLIPGLIAALYYLWLMPRVSAKFGEERNRVMSEVITHVDDYVRGIRVNRLYGAQVGALASYRQSVERFTSGIVEWVKKVATAGAFAVALLQAVATLPIAYFVTSEQGTLVTAAAMLFGLAIVTPVLKLGHGVDYVRAGRRAAQRLSDLFSEQLLPSGCARIIDRGVVLEAEKLTLKAGSRLIMDRESHRFLPGTLSVISGPSGAGKTTFLRALAGLESADSGEVRIAGVNIATLDENVRSATIKFLPQACSVLDTSVRENLRLGSADLIDEMLEDALRLAHLDTDLDRSASQLSGGEKQRLGLARSFLADAPLLVLDEPTSALDRSMTLQVVNTIKQQAHTTRKTIILVSHDPEVIALADQHLEVVPEAEGLSQ